MSKQDNFWGFSLFFLIAVAHVYVSHIFPIHDLAPWKKNTRAKWTWTNDLFLRLLICLGLHAPACPYVGCPRWHHLRLHCAAQPDWFLSNRLCVGRGGAVNHRVLSAEPLDKRKGGRDIKKSSSSTEQHAHSPLYVIFAPTLSAATPQFSPLYGVYISFLLSFLSLYCTYPTIPSLSLSKSTRVTHLSLERKREEEEEKSLNLGLIYETKMARDSLVV